MRLFTLLVSAVFVVTGAWMILSGAPYGWHVAVFFGICLLVAVFEPWFSKFRGPCEYRLLITDDEVACEHPRRKRESIRWEDVNRIWLVTTADGPYLPDCWILFEGENAGCSIPTEASDFDRIWDELERRFPGFNYKPLIEGGTEYARHLCWEHKPLTSPSPA